jgi:hypothetical protein
MTVCLHTILIALITLSLLAQSPPKRKKVKNFGSSLKRLKWMASLATVSGGWADFLEKPEQADAIYSRIFSDINQRYIVGYYPANKERDGKRRKIEFKVKGHPEYQVYGRLSYFAPEP